MQRSRVGSCSRWEGARDTPSEILADGQKKGERRASPTASSDSCDISPTIVFTFGSETSTDSFPHGRASPIAPVIEGAGLKFPPKAWGSASDADSGMRNAFSNFYVQKDEGRLKLVHTVEVLSSRGVFRNTHRQLQLKRCTIKGTMLLPFFLPLEAGKTTNSYRRKSYGGRRIINPLSFQNLLVEMITRRNDSSKSWANHGACSESNHSEIVVNTPAGLTRPENVTTHEIEECDSLPRLSSPPLNPRYLEDSDGECDGDDNKENNDPSKNWTSHDPCSESDHSEIVVDSPPLNPRYREDSDGGPMLRISSELHELEAESKLCSQYDSAPDGEVSRKTIYAAIVEVTVIFRKVVVVFARSSLSSGMGVIATGRKTEQI
ncbi:hypothetical protein R1sor_023717 [Riccia sorocarpa]|uniref:Uncharacterized protein n=1 Tax=Riccia sorocarpa TaxID=122646 RepID=A0ABD3GQ90_9MARC